MTLRERQNEFMIRKIRNFADEMIQFVKDREMLIQSHERMQTSLVNEVQRLTRERDGEGDLEPVECSNCRNLECRANLQPCLLCEVNNLCLGCLAAHELTHSKADVEQFKAEVLV